MWSAVLTAPGTLRRRRCHRAAAYSAASVFAAAALLAVGVAHFAQSKPSGAPAGTCAGDNGGITLPPGFCATVFADNLGHARHIVFGPNGVLYVNTWSGRYYRNDTLPAGGFLVAIKDSKGDGHADVIERFGDGVPQGATGGTGIATREPSTLSRTTRSSATPCRRTQKCRNRRRKSWSPICR